MDKDIAMRWADALESGAYKQGKGRLRNDKNQFCCLGVLCNLHAQDHPDIASQQQHPTNYMNHTLVLPESVKSWSGMHSKLGWSTASSLAHKNDHGWDFRRIATYIRENWREL